MATKSKGLLQLRLERINEMMAMRKQGKKWEEIATTFGIDPANACRTVRLHVRRQQHEERA